MTLVYVDADACPVKDEVYKVAARYGVPVVVVANRWIRVPREAGIRLEVVAEGPDAADDWIAERAGPPDVVVTADLPLAGRVLTAGSQAIRPNGRVLTADSIGEALASRAVAEHLRSFGQNTAGPPPFTAADRSRFLQALDAALVRAKRAAR